MIQMSETSRCRLESGIRKFVEVIARGQAQGMNQASTTEVISAMLGELLGFDPFFDVTTESSVRGPYADKAVVMDGDVKFLLITRALGAPPRHAHVARFSGRGTPAYAEWAVVTNADCWACYRLGVGMDRHPEEVFTVCLSGKQSLAAKTMLFHLLSKEGTLQDALAQYWVQTQALNPVRVASILLSEPLVSALRRELQRATGYRPERAALLDILLHAVIRPEVVGTAHVRGELPDQAACYAYSANASDPSTWRLCYRNADGAPNLDRLLIAAAQIAANARALGIPPDDLPIVKQRLTQAFLELGLPTDELPPELQP